MVKTFLSLKNNSKENYYGNLLDFLPILKDIHKSGHVNKQVNILINYFTISWDVCPLVVTRVDRPGRPSPIQWMIDDLREAISKQDR